jgi:hypothetical protein
MGSPGTKKPKDAVPVVKSDKPLWLMVAEVQLTARHPATAAAAFDLWKATRSVMDQFDTGANSIEPNGLVRPLDEGSDPALAKATADYTEARRRFINAVRSEFRLPEM